MKSLQVQSVDRLSSLTKCRREIGKEKVADLLGNVSNSQKNLEEKGSQAN